MSEVSREKDDSAMVQRAAYVCNLLTADPTAPATRARLRHMAKQRIPGGARALHRTLHSLSKLRGAPMPPVPPFIIDTPRSSAQRRAAAQAHTTASTIISVRIPRSYIAPPPPLATNAINNTEPLSTTIITLPPAATTTTTTTTIDDDEYADHIMSDDEDNVVNNDNSTDTANEPPPPPPVVDTNTLFNDDVVAPPPATLAADVPHIHSFDAPATIDLLQANRYVTR